MTTEEIGRVYASLIANSASADFVAGWNARTEAIDEYLMHDKTPDVEEAWERYAA